jgi:hypothetical protein
MCSLIGKNIEVFLKFLKYFGHLPFTKDLSCLPFYKSLTLPFIFQIFQVVFYFPKTQGCLPLDSTSIFQIIEIIFHFLKIKLSFNIQYPKIEVVFHLQYYLGHLAFTKIFTLSSFFSRLMVFHYENN